MILIFFGKFISYHFYVSFFFLKISFFSSKNLFFIIVWYCTCRLYTISVENVETDSMSYGIPWPYDSTKSNVLEDLANTDLEDKDLYDDDRCNFLSDFNPELSQLNQDFHPRYKLVLILTRNCHNLTRIFTPGINWFWF